LSAGLAGEVRLIAAMLAGLLASSKLNGKHREDIARLRKAKSNTENQKTVVDTVKSPKQKKRWLIHLPQCCPHGVRQ